MDGRERREELFFRLSNELKLPLFRAFKRVGRAYEGYRRSRFSPIHVLHDDFSSRMVVIEFDLPNDRVPIRYVLYVSTQSWYLTPSKLEPKIRKVLKYSRRYSSQANTYRAVICMRYTKGAARLGSKYGVFPRTPKQLRRDMIKYFKEERYLGLLASLRGKRLFGELAFLAWLLQEVLKELGVTDIPTLFKDEIDALRAAETGIEIPQNLGPP